MFGYMGKLLFVNLSTGEIEIRPLSEEYAKNFMGGPSLGARILYDEMPANTDPFGEASMIGFVTGPLSGTNALFSGRYTVVSKSPVTGGWNDANSGGGFGPKLKASGFDAVFVNGISDRPVYVYIDSGKAELRDASALWGLTTLETEDALKKEHGDKINAALIAPAGENMSLISAVMNDGHRAAGRGGSGAVMGSKKLKAIVVNGSLKVEVADAAKIMENNQKTTGIMKGIGAGMAGAFGTYGTGVGYTGSVMSGDAGVKNWGGSGAGDHPEEVAAPVGSIALDKFKQKSYHCSRCPLGCGAFLDIPSERWDLSHTPRTEYETQGSFGSMLLNNDFESVSRCNDLCNEYGLDTISAGSTVAWTMECYNNGLFTREELDGIDLKWGAGDAIVELTEKIGKCEGVGAILAKGTHGAADHFGRGHEYLVVASGIEQPQHDGRLAYGLTRTYQYDPTPGRHTKGGLGFGPKVGPDKQVDYRNTGYKDLLGVIDQEICNSSGYCIFGVFLSGGKDAIMSQVMASTGFTYSPADVHALGIRMFNMRQAFNLREGLRRGDFTLSKRMYESDPPFDGPLAGNKIDHERLADNFFNAIGWTADAVPTKESLLMIGGMDDVIADLYPPAQP